MMLKSVLSACFLLCLLLSPTLGAPAPFVNFSTNATSTPLGQSVKLTCQLENFTPGNDPYRVYFYQDKAENSNYFWVYRFSALTNLTFNRSIETFPSLLRHALPSAFPVYEITITPTTSGSHVYFCNLYVVNSLDVYSTKITITATPPSLPAPSAVLTSNVTSVTVGHPFTVTCTFANFHPIPDDYSVLFSSSRDGQLAVYEVAGGKALLSDAVRQDVQVSTGERSTYPVFDLIITEKVDSKSSYTCALVAQGEVTVRSNTWPALVTFKASQGSVSVRTASCDIGATGLNLTDQTEYSVQFWSDAGPKTVNLLAEFIFKPHHAEEFKYHQVAPWISIAHGADTSAPSFSILAHVADSLHGTWWCLLAVGQQGAPGYRELTSNKAHL